MVIQQQQQNRHPAVSVVIPTYRRIGHLLRCLTSLSLIDQSRESFETIVVNDGGDPSAVEKVRDNLPHGFMFTTIHRQHRGVAAARSCGIKQSRGEILAFLDDDCVVPPDYITSIMRIFRTYPETQVIQVALENPDPSNIYRLAWKINFDSVIESNLSPARHGRIMSGLLGGVMVAHRNIFEKISYDQSIHPIKESAYFRCELHNLNIPVYYEPTIRVFHYGWGTLYGYLRQHFRYGRGEFHFRGRWGRENLPFQYNRSKTWKDVRSNMTSGPKKTIPLYCIFFLRRLAHRCGLIFEQMKWNLFTPKNRGIENGGCS